MYQLLADKQSTLIIRPDNQYKDYWGESSAITNTITLYYKRKRPKNIDINELMGYYVHEDTHIQQGV
jgi:hypothetical protein